MTAVAVDLKQKNGKNKYSWDYANETYHQTSNISGAKSPNLNVSCLVLQLSLPNPLKPGVKSRMRM